MESNVEPTEEEIRKDIDYGCYLSAYQLKDKIKFVSFSKMYATLARGDFEKYRKNHYRFCYYKYCIELINDLKKYAKRKTKEPV